MSIPELPTNFKIDTSQVSLFEEELKLLDANLSAADKIKQQIIQQAIPDSVFNTSASLDEIEKTINEKTTNLLNNLNVPTVPEISVSSVISKLIPDIPVITLPNAAEIRQFINQRIELKKFRQQTQIIKKIEADADAEQRPFTARREEQNKKNTANLVNINRRFNL